MEVISYMETIVLVLTVFMLKKIVDLVTVPVYGDWGVH
jgi:hypothetical protein